MFGQNPLEGGHGGLQRFAAFGDGPVEITVRGQGPLRGPGQIGGWRVEGFARVAIARTPAAVTARAVLAVQQQFPAS